MAKSSRLKVFLTGRVAAEANGRVLNEARFRRRQGRLSALHVDHRRGCPLVVDQEVGACASARSRLVDNAMPFTSTGCFELACLLLFPFALVPLAQGFGAFVFEVR